MSLSLRRALLLALTATVLAPTSAQAVMTRSTVTSPADPTYRLYERTPKAEPTITVTGTSNAAVKELVDIVCTRGSVVVAAAVGIEVGPNGRFSTDVRLDNLQNWACVLRAVPHQYRGKELQPFDGPMVAVTFFDPRDFTIPVRGSDARATADYYAKTGNRRGYAELRSRGLKDVTAVYPEQLGFYKETWDTAAERHAVEVDGVVAYAGGDVPRFDYDGEGPEPMMAPGGFAGISVSATLDERTGRVTVNESAPVVRCNRWDRVEPPATDCRSVLDTGVRHERAVTFDAEHAVVDVEERWISTDGSPHRVRLAYAHDADENDRPLWRFPGEVRFGYRDDRETVTPKGPGTLLVRGAEGGVAVGALTFNPAPQRFVFDDYDVLADVDELTVPAGGVVPVRRTFALAENVAAAEALARRTEDGFAAPTVSIDGAVPGEGFATVTGRATDNVGVTALTVNGQAVTLGTDGAFSAQATFGTVTVVATDAAGLTATAAIDVTKPAPAPVLTPSPQPGGVRRCTVPRIKKGSTVKAARKALSDAGCKAAKSTKRKRSAKVRKGRVLSLSQRAGESVPAADGIVITVSSGRKKRR